MKKIICMILVFVILLSGCSQKSNVRVLDDEGMAGVLIVKEIMDAPDAFDFGATKHVSWYDISVEDFMSLVNKAAEEKGYDELKPLSKKRMYSYNGETWYILFHLRDDVDEAAERFYGVDLSLFSDSEERAKMNGDYMYILIDQFNPGMAETVVTELGVFDENSNMPDNRKVICGRTQYTYSISYDGSANFEISVIHVPPEEESKPPNVIKPS